MSELILPPGYRHTAQSDKLALERANARTAATASFDPYYSELPKIKAAGDKLNRIFAFSGMEPWTERQFEVTARNLFGEAGFTIEVEWLQAKDPDTGEIDPLTGEIDPETMEDLPLRVPNIIFTGRVDRESERDHDRLRHEIVTGQGPDHQKGYIREDGSKHEEPIRKLIT